jgi:hypothetical protein
MKTRINPKTGREEFWNQPEGLPGIWMTRGFCDRCHQFNKCMGFLELTDAEWKSVEDLIRETNDLVNLEKNPNIPKLKKCSS